MVYCVVFGSILQICGLLHNSEMDFKDKFTTFNQAIKILVKNLY